MAGLKFRHICKTYENNVRAVSNFNLDIQDKEFVVFVGPSGCGKSTTLRMIAGLEKPDSGEIYIGDKCVNGLAPKDRNIAMVFQNYALFPNMTVADNISFGLRMHGTDKDVIKEKVEYAAETLGLKEFLNRKPQQLSGGQKQRVALGRAIVREPDVFLLDEPLSNLDAKLRAKMRSELIALHRKLGTTFVYVTHDQVEAMTMGDKIVVMKDGFVKQVGTPAQLYDHPADKFVAGFIGTPQMNFFSGFTVEENGRTAVITDTGKFEINGEAKYKLHPDTGDGRKVVLGIRPEDIFAGERKKPTNFQAEAAVTNVEDIGTHSIVYYDKTNAEENEEKTFAAFGKSGFEAVNGKSEVYFDTERINLFDAETETSLIPEVPSFVRVNGEVKKGRLNILESSIDLPPLLNNLLTDGAVSAEISSDAVTSAGVFDGRTENTEYTSQGMLCRILCGKETLFALGKFEKKAKFGLDLEKTAFVQDGKRIEPFAKEFRVCGYYVKRRETYGDKNVDKHFVVIGGQETETYYEFNKKMYSQGRSIFRKKLSFGIKPASVRIAFENETYPTLTAVVTGKADYGDKIYWLLDAGGETFAMEATGDCPKNTITVAVDFDSVAVYEADSGNLLFSK